MAFLKRREKQQRQCIGLTERGAADGFKGFVRYLYNKFYVVP